MRVALIALVASSGMCQGLSAQAPTFTDATAAAGIHFKHTDGRSGRFYFVEELGSGAAFLDFDNDADLDVYFVNGADLPGFQSQIPPTNALYRNEGDGKFLDVTKFAGVGDTGYGVGVCGGDTDNDGYFDLYVTNFGRNILYSNNGDGSFADVTDRAAVGDRRWGASCAFGDVDMDGDLDLYATNYVEFALDKNKTCETRGIVTYCNPQDFAGSADVLYRNNEDGTFTDITAAAGVHKPRGRGLGAVWGDYDNDGYLDLYVANDTNENYLFHNEGDGTFVDMALYGGVALSENGEMESGMGVNFGDYDNDRFLDVVVTNFQDQTATLYHNDGDGFFSDVSYVSRTGEKTLASLGWGAGFFDYDNDGYKDLFIANGHVEYNVESFHPETTYEQSNHLFRNLMNGTFEEVTGRAGVEFARRTPSRGAAFGDYDEDGNVDILVTNSNEKAQLFRNETRNDNNWIKVRVVGTTSNRSAIGTRVEIVAGDMSQIADVKSGSSYLSQSDLTVHFGLGSRTSIEGITATFPNGTVSVMYPMDGIKANQLIHIEQPGQE